MSHSWRHSFWLLSLVWLGAHVGCGSSSSDSELDASVESTPDAGPPPVTYYVAPLRDGETGSGSEEDPFRDLQQAISAAPRFSTIILMPGVHWALKHVFEDATCGNCSDAEFRQQIPATFGIHIKRDIVLIGQDRELSIIRTNAGYGIFYEDAGQSRIENLTITGGIRDADGRATNAAIVVKDTKLEVVGIDIVGNDDQHPDEVAGVAGIALREGAALQVVSSRIVDNSWDGIAAYRGIPGEPESAPSLEASNNRIEDGRGVGIGVTWDASAVLRNNYVTGYWKGIGAFGAASLIAENNLIEDNSMWGLISNSSSPVHAANNEVRGNGVIGMSAWSASSKGRFVNNLVVGNGHNMVQNIGERSGLWYRGNGIQVGYNAFGDNVPYDACTGGGTTGDCTEMQLDGVDGNLHFGEDPVLVDVGDPDILDVDGSRSDIGLLGGPGADWQVPAALEP